MKQPLITIVLLAFILGCAQQREAGDDVTSATIETDLGNIVIEFYPKEAPNHVKNFISLAESGFYDGALFHRVIPGFMIQGGDPNTKNGSKDTWGMGGPGHTVNAEFNRISHKRGIVSMARAQDPNSAGSQFFIVVKDSTFLDKQYTVFGYVASGMEVADKIVDLPRDPMDRPLSEARILKVTVKNK